MYDKALRTETKTSLHHLLDGFFFIIYLLTYSFSRNQNTKDAQRVHRNDGVIIAYRYTSLRDHKSPERVLLHEWRGRECEMDTLTMTEAVAQDSWVR